MAPQFDGDVPWIEVFMTASKDRDYWGEHVKDPAQVFLARGGRESTADQLAASIPGNAVDAGNQKSQGDAGFQHQLPFPTRKKTKGMKKQERLAKEALAAEERQLVSDRLMEQC